MTDDPFQAWAARWLAQDTGAYVGSEVPEPKQRLEQLVELWNEPIPGCWQRGDDREVTSVAIRYRRHHKNGSPRPGSEHGLEHEILSPDPGSTSTYCFGARMIDGVNAVPLTRSSIGRRAGNVEADMLLLTQAPDLTHRLLLVEAKTSSNNAWYAVAESLRQLKLFTCSPAAQSIMGQRHPGLPRNLPVAAVVLAPATFYAAAGARSRALKPALELASSLRERLGIDLRLAVWDIDHRVIAEATPPPSPSG